MQGCDSPRQKLPRGQETNFRALNPLLIKGAISASEAEGYTVLSTWPTDARGDRSRRPPSFLRPCPTQLHTGKASSPTARPSPPFCAEATSDPSTPQTWVLRFQPSCGPSCNHDPPWGPPLSYWTETVTGSPQPTTSTPETWSPCPTAHQLLNPECSLLLPCACVHSCFSALFFETGSR